MLTEEPGDTFLTYSLAMEHRSAGDRAQAMALFDELSAAQPPHVPAFFMAAQMLVEQNQFDPARTKLRDGIDEARRQGDSHAAAEMSELLATIGAAGESPADDDL